MRTATLELLHIDAGSLRVGDKVYGQGPIDRVDQDGSGNVTVYWVGKSGRTVYHCTNAVKLVVPAR